MTAPHTTRSAPKCVNCRHYLRTGECDHPAVPVLLTNGRPRFMALSLRLGAGIRSGAPFHPRSPADPVCGPDGLLFAPIDGQVGEGAADAAPIGWMVPQGAVQASLLSVYGHLLDAPAGSRCLSFTTPAGELSLLINEATAQRLREWLAPGYPDSLTFCQSDMRLLTPSDVPAGPPTKSTVCNVDARKTAPSSDVCGESDRPS